MSQAYIHPKITIPNSTYHHEHFTIFNDYEKNCTSIVYIWHRVSYDYVTSVNSKFFRDRHWSICFNIKISKKEQKKIVKLYE